MAVWIWTFGQDATLRRAAKAGRCVADAAAEIGCTHAQAYWRASRLKLKFSDGRETKEPATIDERPEYTRKQLLVMNDAFSRAMLKAIRTRRECAPIGVSTEPSTHYARMRLAYQPPITQSVAADLIGGRHED